MFIRFVKSKSHKSARCFGFASMGIVAFIVILIIARLIKYANGEECISEWLADKAVFIYGTISMQQYKAVAFVSEDDKHEEWTIPELVDVVNSHNSIYSFFEENDVGIVFCTSDPLYKYTDIVVKTDVVIGDNQIADIDNNETDKLELQDENKSDIEDASDYVVPAISEAGVTYTIDQLSDFDFLMSKLYTVPARALVYESDLVAEEMLKKDMTIKGDNSKPQILIYHTHSQEGFVDSIKGDDSTSIIGVGAYLAKILSEEYGYNVIHCQEHFDIAGGKLDRSKAYTYAQYSIEQILQDNPTIDVILDIHRDGLAEGADKLVTNINGKDTAKIMFFNGVSRSSATGDIDYLYNRYRSDNLAFSFQLKLEAMECYPDFTRRNYIDAYQYNLHHREKSVLVEVGAQNNTLQEELNAMEVLAEVLHRVISPKETDKE